MNIPERISALRALMEERGYDVYMVPTDDFHQSEYVGEHFKVREYITGFTGSAGTAVFTKDEAGLWTDGRYFLQADQQLSLIHISLMFLVLRPALLPKSCLQPVPHTQSEFPVLHLHDVPLQH